MIPQDLKFTKTHEWVRIDDEASVATIGITDYAVGQLGDIAYVELPDLGAELTAGEPFGVIESVKAAVDLYAPVSGKVVEVNQPVTDNLDLLSEDPYGKAWMVKVAIADAASLDGLMGPAEYEAHVRGAEGSHA